MNAMHLALLEHLNRETASLVDQGLSGKERVATSAQLAEITVVGLEGPVEIFNLYANIYRGLSNHATPWRLRAKSGAR